MLKLNPVKSEKIWGYELWIASTHENGFQKDFFDFCKGYYPLLVKIIQAQDILSVQVHPDDFVVKKLEDKTKCGKTECWYVLEAGSDSKIVYGLKEGYSQEVLKKAISENKIEEYVNFVNVKQGDFVFIPSGVVHAIGSGLRLLEVQQSCDITYRFYDWGRGREVHVEKALASIKKNSNNQISQFESFFECDYFSIDKINVKGGWSMFVSGNPEPKNVQLIYILSENNAVIKTNQDKFGKKILSEEIYAVYPGEKITVEGNATVLRIKSK